MIYKEEDIKTIIREKKRPDWVHLARSYTEKLNIHTKGLGITEFLVRIEGLETLEQLDLRQKFYISNKHIISSIQRQADNIWTARGGGFVHDIGDEKKEAKFLEVINSINDGGDIYSYMQEEWFEAFRSEPCGGSFIDIEDGTPSSLKQVSINNIFWCDPFGMGVKAILFEPEKEEVEVEGKDEYGSKKIEKEIIEYYTYIDTEELLVFEKRGENIKIKRGSKQENKYNLVPFVWNSTIKGYPNIKLEKEEEGIHQMIRLSVINDELDLLNSIIRKNSTKEIHELFHSYPVFWQYVQVCNKCNGFGSVDGRECDQCGGAGYAVPKKDVANVIKVPIPDEGESDITPPSGYVVPPIEIVQELRAEIKDKKNEVMISHWGVKETETTVQNPSDKTATEIITDIQPKINRLSTYSDNVEKHHNALLDIVLRVMFPGSIKKSNVFYSYGRGYVLETSDTALSRYQDGITFNLPDETLNMLLINYYASLFKRDSAAYERAVKLMRVEPFLHKGIGEVTEMPVGDEMKLKKAMYNEWRGTITYNDIDSNTAEQLREKLTEYINKLNITENAKE